MKKTGAWLIRYALEQLGVSRTFGIPGVHNTETYDELNCSESVTPVLVTHEGGAAFMADGVSRTSDEVGTLLIVPAAGVTHAASGIGEAFLDGIAMLVICGGIRNDLDKSYQLHEMDQRALLEPITKGCFIVVQHQDLVQTMFDAYAMATSGEPGPVFVEVPVNIQLFKGNVEKLPVWQSPADTTELDDTLINAIADKLLAAKHPGLFLGWGATTASAVAGEIADFLQSPVSTTLQGLGALPGNHPLHAGFGYSHAAVPAAENAFANCDCLLAIGTRFSEIATASFSKAPPANLVHIDINPAVFNANYPASLCIVGDAAKLLPALLACLRSKSDPRPTNTVLQQQIRADKQAYLETWKQHDSGGRVNPGRFFETLRNALADDAIIVADDGNHTFLTAELMPIHRPGGFISPTDFNCMGYAVPAAIGAKMVNPNTQVAAIIGDGAFLMTCMETVTAKQNNLGCLFFVFNDGELSQISQAQQIPYNRKTCSRLHGIDYQALAQAIGCSYVEISNSDGCEAGIKAALDQARQNNPVVINVHIDYSKRTRFTDGVVKTNLKRFDTGDQIRFMGRALWRRITG